MERRINENGFLSYIYAVTRKHTHHRGNTPLDRTLSADRFDHRSVEPNGFAASRINAFAPVGAFSDDRRRGDIARFKRMHKDFSVAVNEFRSERTNLFGNERSEYLLRKRSARGVILKSIGIKKFCADTVTENKSVRSRAVVVGGREALIVHTPRSSCRYDNGLCTGDHEFFRLHIHKYGARRSSVFVKNKFDR